MIQLIIFKVFNNQTLNKKTLSQKYIQIIKYNKKKKITIFLLIIEFNTNYLTPSLTTIIITSHELIFICSK